MRETTTFPKCTNEKRVRNCFRGYALFNHHWTVHVVEREGSFYIGGRSDGRRREGGTFIDLQITGDTCFLLGIAISDEYRGSGVGLELYKIAERIALAFGATKMQATPSGTCHDGEHRASYMARKLGYKIIGSEAFKSLRGKPLPPPRKAVT